MEGALGAEVVLDVARALRGRLKTAIDELGVQLPPLNTIALRPTPGAPATDAKRAAAPKTKPIPNPRTVANPAAQTNPGAPTQGPRQ